MPSSNPEKVIPDLLKGRHLLWRSLKYSANSVVARGILGQAAVTNKTLDTFGWLLEDTKEEILSAIASVIHDSQISWTCKRLVDRWNLLTDESRPSLVWLSWNKKYMPDQWRQRATVVNGSHRGRCCADIPVLVFWRSLLEHRGCPSVLCSCMLQRGSYREDSARVPLSCHVSKLGNASQMCSVYGWQHLIAGVV